MSAITKFSIAGNALLLVLLVVAMLGRGRREDGATALATAAKREAAKSEAKH